MDAAQLAGGLVFEHDFLARHELSLSAASFDVPDYVDSRPLCIQASNQGAMPACAGFATAGFKEIDNWKKTGSRIQFDGVECYRKAKTLDGSPTSSGTSLTAALTAGKQLGWFPQDRVVKSVGSRLLVQYCLHRYGVVILGFNITRQWDKADPVSGFIQGNNQMVLGGHAVLGCYYDADSIGIQNSWGEEWGAGGFGRLTWEQFDKQFMYGAIVIDKDDVRL